MGPRTLHKMNATRVRALKIAGLYEDGGGLRLVVTDTGAKRWVMRISMRGSRHQLGLGSYPAVSLERAREKAADIRKAASEGRNILAERRAGKQGVVTFRQAFETFFASKEPTLSNAKHRAQWRSTMEKYVFPTIGNRPVAEVQPDEILAIMKPLWSSKPETAGRVLQRVDAVLHFAIANGWRERASACIGARQVLGSRRNGEDRHYRFLPHQEVPAFVARLRADKRTITKLALEWLILTATRSGETRLARWSEINEQTATWTVPAERMKARRTHVVPLSSRCQEILREARLMHQSADLIFPGSVPYRDTPATVAMRADVDEHNAFVRTCSIAIEHPEVMIDAGGFLAVAGQPRLDPTRTSTRRIFNGDFTRGGRWYGAWWQNMPARLRQFIRIDDMCTIEHDFAYCHVRLLHALAGLAPPRGDPYQVSR
jgi:integrase